MNDYLQPTQAHSVEWLQLSNRMLAVDPFTSIPMTAEEMRIRRDPAFCEFHDQRARVSAPSPEPVFDRDDIEAIFRFLMQLARHFAKKWCFTIKQWPEN